MSIKTRCWQDRTQWHRWFAWRPVWFNYRTTGTRVCETRAWWVYVERKVYHGWDGSLWDYREVKDDQTT